LQTNDTQQPIVIMSNISLIIASITLGLASFMAVVDVTIANVSVPTISGNVGVSSEIGEWVITSFAVSNAIFIPLTGWLSRRFGQKKLFIWSVLGFTFASICCGMSENFSSLLIFRVLQGAISGPIVPLSQSLLVAIFPPEKRPLAVSIWAMTVMAGPVAGPLLGGWITDDYSWPWIFLVNAPVGCFIGTSVFFLFYNRDTPSTKLPVDIIGLIFLALSIGCLQIALDRGRILDWFSSSFICIMLLTSILSAIFLIIWELEEENPIIDLRLFCYRNFFLGTVAVAIGFGLYFAALVLTPLWLQTDMHYTPTWAGLVTAPMGVFGIILAPFLGKWVQKNDPRLFAFLAFVAWAIVSLWRSTMTIQVSAFTISMTCLAQGIGIGLFLTPLVTISLIGIPGDKVASASGLQTAVRMMSGSLLASLAQTFWDERSRVYQNQLVGHIQNYNNIIYDYFHNVSNRINSQQFIAIIYRQLIEQADMLALNDFFFLSCMFFLASGIIVWFTKIK